MRYLNKIALVIFVLVSVYGYIVSCTHDDVVPPKQATNDPIITHGNNVHRPGDMTAGDTSEWKLDKVHSSVLWSTSYVGSSGLLTGRFNQFGMHDATDDKMILYYTTGQPLPDSSWAFYENDPSQTYFNGYVQINTSNTGEPGRDTGCNISNLGTTKIVPGVQNLTVSNLAKIKTTEVKFDELSNDYIVTMNFTWQGKLTAPLTQSLTGRLKYIPRSTINPASGSAYSVFGLQLTFQFNCRDFGITSTSIADKIEMECNMNFHNK